VPVEGFTRAEFADSIEAITAEFGGDDDKSTDCASRRFNV
jgi:hypothetical protein